LTSYSSFWGHYYLGLHYLSHFNVLSKKCYSIYSYYNFLMILDLDNFIDWFCDFIGCFAGKKMVQFDY
jgi:hypothetical protein